jgi:hypothetical protein
MNIVLLARSEPSPVITGYCFGFSIQHTVNGRFYR